MAEGKGTHTAEHENESDRRSPWWERLWARTEVGDKTLWDLLQLLIVPLALAVIGFWFTAQQDARQQQIETQRAEAERELAVQRAQDEALQAYLDQMGSLLLERDLRASEADSEVRSLARARTLTVLSRLDPSRKTALMQFLVEAELVQRVEGREPIISLRGADLRNAKLHLAYLVDANLFDAKLSDANLKYARGITQEKLKKQANAVEGASLPTGLFVPEFKPTFQCEIGKGWLPEPPETPDFERMRSTGLLGLLLFTNPVSVFDPSNLGDPKKLPAPESVTEWVSWFQRHPNLDTSKPVPVRVGGASGMRIEVTASSTTENYPRDLCGGLRCVPLFRGSTDESMILSSEGRKDRFAIVDVGGETVLIDVAAPADYFDAVLPKPQEVLDSVEWIGEKSGSS